MTRQATRPVVSGRCYHVLEAVAGEPAALRDFVGETRFVLDLDGDVYAVCGVGRLVGDAVRFYEKDHAGVGCDVRIWSVRPLDGAPGFGAVHVTA